MDRPPELYLYLLVIFAALSGTILLFTTASNSIYTIDDTTSTVQTNLSMHETQTFDLNTSLVDGTVQAYHPDTGVVISQPGNYSVDQNGTVTVRNYFDDMTASVPLTFGYRQKKVSNQGRVLQTFSDVFNGLAATATPFALIVMLVAVLYYLATFITASRG